MWKGQRNVQTLGILCIWAISLVSCQSNSTQRKFTYGYLPFWVEAQQRCMAKYPKESLAEGHQGLAVVELQIGRDGVPVHVAVLQVPDAAIGQSVQRCASAWRMKPVEPNGPDIRAGKLYFYFVNSSDSGKVYLANDPADKKALVALRPASLFF